MKKFILVKMALIGVCGGFLLFIIIAIISSLAYSAGADYQQRILTEMRADSTVVNNQLYATRYKKLLNKYLFDRGYVSLERLVYYLQRKNNILDTTSLNDILWDEAYVNNSDTEYKQMIPIKTICKTLKYDASIPAYTIESGKNKNGFEIDKLDLCNVNGIDVAESDEYSDIYPELPFVYPLSKELNLSITSIVFEFRNIEFGFSSAGQNSVNNHSGWDIGVPTGTEVYSICDGTIKSIVNTQDNDLNYYQQTGIKNSTGNYVEVICDNGLISNYYHLKYKTTPLNLSVGTHITKGTVIAKSSTTGTSTGPHLHLGLKDATGKKLDAFAYIKFNQ